jgi:hypothetical protein
MGNNVAAIVSLIFLLGTLNTAVAAEAAKPATGLEKHCADIRMVFEAVKFTGAYRKRADAYLGGGCVGEVPLPSLRDPQNVKRFNAAGGILYNGAKISITQ